MKTILQTEAAECALACVCMICDEHGMRMSLSELRARLPLSLKGVNLQQLMGAASSLGFTARAVRVDLHELANLTLPCILHWDLKHFVVLTRVTGRHAVIVDPAIGERRRSLEEISKHFTGVALELSPGVDFKPIRSPSKVNVSQLTGRMRGLSRALLQIFSVALVLQLLAIVAPLFNQLVVDEALASHDQSLLTVIVMGFALLLIVQTALALMRSWMVMVIGQSVRLQWATNVFSHLVRLPSEWFERRHLGDVASRFAGVSAIQRTVTTALVEAVLDGIMAITALIVMFLYSWKLALATLVAVLLYALTRVFSYRPLRDASAERLVVGAHEHSHFLETLRAITPIKLFGKEEERRNRWHNLMVDVQNRDAKTTRLNIFYTTANGLIFGIENLVVFWIGAGMILAGSSPDSSPFTVGMLFAFISYKGQFTSRVTGLINYGIEVNMLGLHLERLADIVLTEQDKPRLPMPQTNADTEVLPASLELRNVSFRYGALDPWTLKNVNLKIEAGESVAIVGQSGCGKTTLLKVMLGLLKPVEGQILYGGVDVERLGWETVRQRIGVVMQDDSLLAGSIADNMSFFDIERNMQSIEAAARKAHIHAEVERMPMRYDSLVGHAGSALSGGQRQRVLLARALYKKPQMSILDEATSHLDLTNERLIAQTIATLNVTRITAAHRPETIAGCQRVLQVKDGAVTDLPKNLQAPSAAVPAADSEPLPMA